MRNYAHIRTGEHNAAFTEFWKLQTNNYRTTNMSASTKQTEFKAPELLMESDAQINSTQSKDKLGRSKPDSKLILLIILMFLFASPLIILLANSSFINPSYESDVRQTALSEQSVTLEDIKAVNTDLNNVIQNLSDTVENADLKDKQVETKKAEIKPDPVVTAPVVVKSGNDKLKTERRITASKEPAVIIKSPEVIIPATVSSVSVIPDVKEELSKEIVPVADIKPAYIKFDANGNQLEDDAEQWICVQDTKNGLMWEVKSNDESMRDAKNLYSWFDPDTVLKGKPDGGRCKGGTDCDTSSYLHAMNEQNYCGHSDWRLPTREEMMRLVKYENDANTAKIDTRYFPETLPSWYWTASANTSRPEYAWYVLFKNGIPLNDLKENPKHIRLVRNNPSS